MLNSSQKHKCVIQCNQFYEKSSGTGSSMVTCSIELGMHNEINRAFSYIYDMFLFLFLQSYLRFRDALLCAHPCHAALSKAISDLGGSLPSVQMKPVCTDVSSAN